MLERGAGHSHGNGSTGGRPDKSTEQQARTSSSTCGSGRGLLTVRLKGTGTVAAEYPLFCHAAASSSSCSGAEGRVQRQG